jgi:hypothetical protein
LKLAESIGGSPRRRAAGHPGTGRRH